MSDPTDTWRATFAATGQSSSARLRDCQAALAASQADLTAMQAQRDALAVLNDELRAEAKDWRRQADHWLTQHRDTARDLARANRDNRRLQAELDSALGALNEKEET